MPRQSSEFMADWKLFHRANALVLPKIFHRNLFSLQQMVPTDPFYTQEHIGADNDRLGTVIFATDDWMAGCDHLLVLLHGRRVKAGLWSSR